MRRSKSGIKILQSDLYKSFFRNQENSVNVLASSSAARTSNTCLCSDLKFVHHKDNHPYMHIRRSFSSNVLGYSPMANVPPSSNLSNPSAKGEKRGEFGTVDAQTAIRGGVWAQTSAKIDKIVELKGELKEGQSTLDEAATETQKLDLDLADGLKVLAKAKDEGWENMLFSPTFQEFLVWLDESEKSMDDKNSIKMVDKSSFEAHLTDVIRKADKILKEIHPNDSLIYIRDFIEPPTDTPHSTSEKNSESPSQKDIKQNTSLPPTTSGIPEKEEIDYGVTLEEIQHFTSAFQSILQYYQAILLKAAATDLMNSWDSIVQITDGDLDRAAIKGMDPPNVSSLPLIEVNAILKSYLHGSCQDTISSWWKLLDHDQDGLLDESQMEQVAHRTIKPYHMALPILFKEAVDAYPTFLPLPTFSVNQSNNKDKPKSIKEAAPSLGFIQKRREKKSRKKLNTIFSKTLERHFEVEAEMPHRLRCIYEWAEKKHQDNKLESVLLDTGADNTVTIVVGGKKRYVELRPKISLSEFLVEQQDHLKHLDRVGQEIMGSFKEDLHVEQGKGRQNQELRREMGIFFSIVAVLDVGVSFL